MNEASPGVVGFVGIGAMGSEMVPCLARAGIEVLAYDVDGSKLAEITLQPGVAAAGSLADMSELDLVICMLPSSDVVGHVLTDEGGLFEVLVSGAVVVDMGSSDPRRTRVFAEAGLARGIQLVDAPVSGGTRGAREGTLTIMFGGGDDQFERCEAIFSAIGDHVVRMGDVGAGHAMKAINNLTSAVGLSIACESLKIGRRFSLDPEAMLEALNTCTGRNNATETKISQYVLSESFASGFTLRLMLKDITTAVALAHDAGVVSTLGDACLDLWQRTAAELPLDADQTHIARAYRPQRVS